MFKQELNRDRGLCNIRGEPLILQLFHILIWGWYDGNFEVLMGEQVLVLVEIFRVR